MARIGKAEHPRILQMVDVEKRRVADVAAAYGCTPANIYALLGKLRRERTPGSEGAPSGETTTGRPRAAAAQGANGSGAGTVQEAPASSDLFASGCRGGKLATSVPPREGRGQDVVTDTSAMPVETERRQTAVAAPGGTVASSPGPVRADNVTDLRRQAAARVAGGVGAALARPGTALVMRTADGEESINPFRLLDDLLSAVKPLLRAAARSPETVWFSIQPVDLASLDTDAA